MTLGYAVAPGERAHVIQIVVADGHLAAAKGLPADARAFRRAGVGRDFDVAQPDRILAEAGDKAQPVRLRIVQEDGRGQKVSARSEERRVGKECRSRWEAYH